MRRRHCVKRLEDFGQTIRIIGVFYPVAGRQHVWNVLQSEVIEGRASAFGDLRVLKRDVVHHIADQMDTLENPSCCRLLTSTCVGQNSKVDSLSARIRLTSSGIRML